MSMFDFTTLGAIIDLRVLPSDSRWTKGLRVQIRRERFRDSLVPPGEPPGRVRTGVSNWLSASIDDLPEIATFIAKNNSP